MGYGSAYAPPRSIGPLSPDPIYGGYPLRWAEHFRRAKSEWQSIFTPGHWALSLQKLGPGAVPQLRLGLPSQRSRSVHAVGAAPCGRPEAFPLQGGRCPRRGRMRVTSWLAPGGRPKGLPYPVRECLCRTVGEGLKVNRLKAERSHPGVCPSRRILKIFSLPVGPASVRPLRKDRRVPCIS